MKIILSTLNSKYVHTSLALRYLRAYCQREYRDIGIAEYSINDNADFVMGELYRLKPDIIGFSVYIWNIDDVLQIVSNFKKVSPDTKIILGGPEVSFDGVAMMENNPWVDYVIAGEGEQSLLSLLRFLVHKQGRLEDIEGLIYREPGSQRLMYNSQHCMISDLNSIPFPYNDEDVKDIKGRIIYYEASRGCPFNCSYCLSSTIKGVRFFNIDRVKEELLFFIKNEVGLVKFVDRTFNSDKNFAREIVQFIIENRGKTSFHFEITASMMDKEFIEIIKSSPRGLIQFEIGVQTTNSKSLRAINRPITFEKIEAKISEVIKTENIHVHLDLIAGLPHENLASFEQSFNDVYSLNPDKLQLGFLKLLKGSSIRLEAEQGGYGFRSNPPYQVLYNNWLSFEDMLLLTDIEDIVEKFFNSHRFTISLNYLISKYSSPFQLYRELGEFWVKNQYHTRSHNPKFLYRILYDFAQWTGKVDMDLFNQTLKFDYLIVARAVELPDPIRKLEDKDYIEAIYNFFNDRANVEAYLPNLKEYSSKQIYRMAHIEIFERDIEAFIISGYDETKAINGRYPILFNYITNPWTSWTKWNRINLNM